MKIILLNCYDVILDEKSNFHFKKLLISYKQIQVVFSTLKPMGMQSVGN